MGPTERMRGWLTAGTALFDQELGCLTDTTLTEPSSLPGWSRAHVASHVAANAVALTRLCRWAATGIELRMYPDSGQRDAEIHVGAALPSSELRAMVTSGRVGLATAMGTLDTVASPAGWAAVVTTAQGRMVPAIEIAWLRVREVWIHTVDLNIGVGFGDFPPELVDSLIDDIARLRGRRGQGPELVLAPSDRRRTWVVPGRGTMVPVAGSAAEIAALLAGRGRPDQPDIGPWI